MVPVRKLVPRPQERPTQRPHKPNELGPAIFRRGRWWAADLRPWGGGRNTLRDPKHARWPRAGDRTEERDVADRWKWEYVSDLRGERRRKHLGLDAKPRPLAERVTDYLDHRRRQRLAANTIRCDTTALELHLLPRVGRAAKLDVADLSAVQALVDDLLTQGYERSSVQRVVHSLGSFFEWCGIRNDDNPARLAELPEKVKREIHAWSDAEIEQLRDAADALDAEDYNGWFNAPASMRRVLELGLATGGRKLELAGLTEGAFRFNDRTVRFVEQLSADGRTLLPLKGKEARTTLVLPSWWEHHRPRAHRADRVLQWRGGQPNASTLQHWMQRLYDRAELNAPGRSWHMLRHTYARIFIESGGRLEELQKSLGHKSIVTTEQDYGHFHEDAAALLARQRIYRDGVGPRQSRPASRRSRRR